jgi:primosomal protein N'
VLELSNLLLGTQFNQSATRPLKSGANPEHPKLQTAQRLLQENPALTRKCFREQCHVSSVTLDDWVKAGWLKFTKPQTARKVSDRDDPSDPKLKEVQNALEKNPARSKQSLAIAYSVAPQTLRHWEGKGWIKIQPHKRTKNTLYWLPRNGGTKVLRPYDPSMKRTTKKP